MHTAVTDFTYRTHCPFRVHRTSRLGSHSFLLDRYHYAWGNDDRLDRFVCELMNSRLAWEGQ